MNSLPRERKCAVVDKKKSLINYMKSNSNSDNKQEAIKRLTQNSNLNIEEILKKAETDNLPMPPMHSNTEKVFKNNLENKNVIFLKIINRIFSLAKGLLLLIHSMNMKSLSKSFLY